VVDDLLRSGGLTQAARTLPSWLRLARAAAGLGLRLRCRRRAGVAAASAADKAEFLAGFDAALYTSHIQTARGLEPMGSLPGALVSDSCNLGKAMHDEVRVLVRAFVLRSLDAQGVNEVGDQDSLLENNVVDSLGIFQLIAFLEESFGIRVRDEEIVLENFRSIDHVVAFVVQKRNGDGSEIRAAI
jgi:acyl carrier protein